MTLSWVSRHSLVVAALPSPLQWIGQRADGPARHELLFKLLFPPFRWLKEGNELVRNVLEPSAAELPQDVAQFVVCIHCRESSRVGTCLFREHESSIVRVCDTTTTKNNFRAPEVSSRRYIIKRLV